MARVELLVARQEVLMGQLREAVVRCEYIRLQIEEAQQELQALTDETKKIK